MDLRQFVCLVFLTSLRCLRCQVPGCRPDHFPCADGMCVALAWRCDGDGDCLDGSDEMGCAASPVPTSSCPPGQFACIGSPGCVGEAARCDGQRQCASGSDEVNCTASSGCLDSDWTCRNQICIPKELRCNGKDDCLDGSDETGCGRCDQGSFRCADGMCLSAEEKCDGKIHCSDGRDEPNTCGRKCSASNGGCSHVCVDEPWGALCSCPTGYKLAANGAICEDVDECSLPLAPCQHYCVNAPGSYYCHCREGFTQKGTNLCLATGNATRFLIVWKRSVGLLSLTMKSERFKDIRSPGTEPVAVTFDLARGWYYWADNQGSIYRTDGQHSRTLFTGEPGIKSLACDWLNDQLYWTNQKTASIDVGNADGRGYATLMSKDVDPLELVLFPMESSMFWVNSGPGDRMTLEKAWMDGSKRSSVVVLTAQNPHSLTMDVAARRLYWISDFKKSIETVKLDGSGRYSFLCLSSSRQTLGLAVFATWFYWTDEAGLWRAPQNYPKQKGLLQKSVPQMLTVYHELQQPKGSSPCANTKCQICLPTGDNPAGLICTCPDTKLLMPDGTCEYPRFAYATSSTINLLELKGGELIKTEVFSPGEDVVSFDVDWYTDWIYWANGTGQVKRISLTQPKTQTFATLKPVCKVKVDQRTGNYFWVSCDHICIGVTVVDSSSPRLLYRAGSAVIRDIYLDWLRGGLYWLEEGRILTMSLSGGSAKEVMNIGGGVTGGIALDLRANTLLWTNGKTGLSSLSLLQRRTYQAGSGWNFPGTVMAAFEPFLVSLSNDVITLWDRRDGSRVRDLLVGSGVVGVIAALKDLKAVSTTPPVCNSPSVTCPQSAVCVSQAQLCDGRKDCPDGFDEDLCVTKCPNKGDFKCKDRRSCVSRSLVCDGRSHCYDGSDEVGCPTIAAPTVQAAVLKCRLGSRPCKDGRECVLHSHVCDGERDCQDGSDEEGCQQACKKGEFQCAHGQGCISLEQVCDGTAQCQDRSDELDCWKPTEGCHHRCDNDKRCIPDTFLCDGERDCLDGSDEQECDSTTKRAPVPNVRSSYRSPPTPPPTQPSCYSPSLLCPGSSLCVPPTQLCDGQTDCPDGSDEEGCVRKCPNRADFRCKDRRRCVSRSLVCDGRSHCHDGSDEVGCPTIAAPTVQTAALKCRLGSRPCKDGRECVLHSHVCDGERDCQDGSDEEGCDSPEETPVQTRVAPAPSALASYKYSPPAPPGTPAPTQPACLSPSVLCPGSSLCVSQTQLCDGQTDCPDGFDEESCVKRCPYKSDFRCKDRRSCVSRSLVCDGRSHCYDGSDEVGCPTIAAPTVQAAVLKCRLGSRPCKDGRECVLHSHVCDGERDCQDGSDEEGCDSPEETHVQTPVAPAPSALASYKYSPPAPPGTPAPTQPACLSPSVLCPGSSLCVSQTQLCDGQTDCPDGFDEESCVKRCPYKSDFRCKDRRSCVSRTLVCDGRSHCYDGSDEVGCPTIAAPTVQTAALKCRLGSRPCKDGRECVLHSHVCDGERDCQDGSDEQRCDAPETTTTTTTTTTPPPMAPVAGARIFYKYSPPAPPGTPAPTQPACLSPSVLCPGSSLCVSQTQLCDGQTDCPDGFDEESCVKRCPYKTDFRCKDRRSCVSRTLVCDGRSHCHDGSDEVGCPTIAAPTVQTAALKCRLGSRPCKDGRECVLHSHLCDGERDCQDGSDEEGCQQACKEGEFQCAHGKRCVPQQQVCDGTAQCQDRSDELNCWKPTTSCQHRCDNDKRCIPATFLCDGERDCFDGTDEKDCDPGAADPDEQTTPTPSTQPACLSPSVLCPGSSLCISQTQLCDGQTDCPDGFDEQSCVDQCENTADFLCRDRRKCIPRAQVCDGRSHCPDGSDERQCQSEAPSPPCRLRCDQGSVCLTDKQLCDGRRDCKDRTDEKLCSSDGAGRPRAVTLAPVKCRLGSKPCKDGRECVPHSHVCDGERDCQDGSDEEGCASQCKSGEFQCAHGQRCVPQQQVCDGTAQCQDRSDELDCWKPTTSCQHRCDNATRCIPETFLCDGEEDCTDGSDEKTCGLEPCGTGQYRCASGQCVSEGLHCDGHVDCRDHSDETGCAKPPRCPPELRCPHSHECLLKEWFCDGEEDCKDGSDEKTCPASPVKCGEYQWSCVSRSQCVPLSWRCDRQTDCHDGSDEAGCGQSRCPPQLFQCGSGECVDPALVCNRITNCADGSDEGTGCLQQNCSSAYAPRCDHHCISTPHGPRCGCSSGFRLQASGVSCVDVDECSEMKPAACKHTCLNTRGSYLCRCYPGYLLEPDNRSCKTTDEPWLLASVQSELLLLGVRSSNLRLLSSASRPVFSLDYHWGQHRVYWLSPDHQSIRWATTDNSHKQGTLVKGVKSDSIAVDWVGRNLYWVDGLAGQILAVPLGNTTVKPQNYSVVLDEDLEQPRSLVLLPHRGLMLWSEIGSSPQIERSGMDGSERKVVVSRGLSWPVSLTFDLLADRLYWTDEKLRCIGSASLDGEDVKLLQLAETPSPFSVAIFNDRVYWSDTKRRTIRSADKNTGKNQKVLLKRPGQPFGLRLIHPLSQPAVSSPCDQLHCSHLCLLAPAPGAGARAPGGRGLSAVCRCPAGLLLSGDGLTCSPPVDTAFLLLLSPTTITQIYLRSMRVGVGLKQWPDHRVLALPGVNEASGLDAALQGHALYVADAGQGSVGLLKLGSSGSNKGLIPDVRILKLQDDSVTALAVDWVTTNLYWSSAKQSDLYVTSPHGGFTTSLLQGTLQGTTSIALHPPSGRLCFTTLGTVEERSQPQVDCSYMDGRNRAALWKKASVPASLVFSNTGTTLYWADIGEGVISSIGLDGSGYKQYKAGPGLLVSFTRTENMLLWVTIDRDVTRLWFSDSFQPKQLWFEVKTNIVALRAYSKNSQKGSSSCSDRNGDCEQLCLAYPNGRTCKCGRDFHPVNVTSCAPSPHCPSGSKACWDGSRCLPSAKFCDGVFDCLDHSDEQECSHSNLFGAKSKTSSLAIPVDSGPSVQRASTSCDLQRCGGHGNCVTEGKVTRCQCMIGYKGEFCQEGVGPQGSHALIVLSVLCLVAGFVAAGVIIRRRRVWTAIRNRGMKETLMTRNRGMKETLMTSMEDRTVYSESFSNDLYEPDEEEEQVFSEDSPPKPRR